MSKPPTYSLDGSDDDVIIDEDRTRTRTVTDPATIASLLNNGCEIFFEPTDVIDCLLEHGGVKFHCHRMPLMRGSRYFTTALKPPYDGTVHRILPTTHPTMRFNTDVPNILGRTFTVEMSLDSHPFDVLLMLCALYSDRHLSPMSTAPTLKVRADGHFSTTGHMKNNGHMSDIEYITGLPAFFGACWWHHFWDCTTEVDWRWAESSVRLPSASRLGGGHSSSVALRAAQRSSENTRIHARSTHTEFATSTGSQDELARLA